MKRIIASALSAVMLLALLAGIVCLPVSALDAAKYGECTLWSDKVVYEVGDPIWVKGSVQFNSTDPSKPAWIGLIVRDHSEWGGLRYVYPKDMVNDQPLDLAGGYKGTHGVLAPYQNLPVGKYTIVLVPDDLPLAGEVYRKENILMSIDIEIVEKKADPAKAPVGASYTIDNPKSGLANGIVKVELPSLHCAKTINMFWGTEDGPLEGYTGLAAVKVSTTEAATEEVFSMTKNTLIPPGATHLLVYTANVNGELSTDYVAVELPEGCNYQFPADQPLVEFQVVSDIHISTAIREAHYRAMLQDIAENSPNSIGIFVAGDSVDSGPTTAWWEKLWALYDDVEGLPHMYLGIGNHEFTGYQSYEPALEQFLKYLRLPDGMEKPTDVPYYDTWIEGFHFIVLGNTVYEKGVRATIGEEQYEWLEEKLGEATDDRPIFLFMHQGLKNTVSGTSDSEAWWGINDDAKLRELLKEYPNIFLFTGHTHSTMNWPNSMYGGGKNAALFNTGSVADLWISNYNHTGEALEGSQGLYVQVYGETVVVRGRDFETGEWVASAQFVVNDRYSVKPDTTALSALIAELETLDAAGYTAESWQPVADALADAKKALTAKSQKDVDAALEALTAVKNALVAVPAPEAGCASALCGTGLVSILTLGLATATVAKKRKED